MVYLLFLFIVNVFGAHATTSADDKKALSLLKSSIYDPKNSLKSWNMDSNVCSWKGINCSLDGKVIGLNMSGLSLSGTLPIISVTHLPDLKNLSLSANNFTTVGNISFLNCSSLEYLDISLNQLSHVEVSSLFLQSCQRLKYLNISRSCLSGVLTAVESLRSLKVLDASHNDLSGSIPTIPRGLEVLDLSSNFLTGSLSCFETMSSLKKLIMANNRVRSLSSVTECYPNLEVLDLSFNYLNEIIPQDLCEKVPKLQHIVLTYSHLKGTIPASIGDCTALLTLIMNYNELEGHIPSEISKLAHLIWLVLGGNRLSGTIPHDFGNLQHLEALTLNGNKLQGELPINLSKCGRLIWLDVSNNSLSGSIPLYIGRTHPGPYQMEAVSDFTPLVDTHYFHECDKSSILEFFPLLGISETEFTSLSLACNKRLYDKKQLDIVDSLSYLDLSYNTFTGSIPKQFGEMQSLYALNLAHNLLTGTIPSELALIRVLTIMDVSQNRLEGHIPAEFSSMGYLSAFNVSYNNLSGKIPQQGQLTTLNPSSYEGNLQLCGLPLNIDCQKTLNINSQDNNIKDVSGGDDGYLLAGLVTGIPAFLAWCFIILRWPFAILGILMS